MEEIEDAVPSTPHHTNYRHEEVGEAAKENETMQVLSLGLATDANEKDLCVTESEKRDRIREDDQAHRNVKETHLKEKSLWEGIANPGPADNAIQERIPNTMAFSNRRIAEALKDEE